LQQTPPIIGRRFFAHFRRPLFQIRGGKKIGWFLRNRQDDFSVQEMQPLSTGLGNEAARRILAVLMPASLAQDARRAAAQGPAAFLASKQEIVATGFKQIERSEKRIRSASHQRICSLSGKYGMDSFQGLNSQRLNPP